MPRIEFPDNGFVAATVDNDNLIFAERKRYKKPFEYIGEGIESLVIATPLMQDEVIAFSFSEMSLNEAKIQFYLQRALSTLFPHNFPHISFARGGHGIIDSYQYGVREMAGTIRERIRPGRKALYPFSTTVISVCEQIGIPIKKADLSKPNLKIGSDGGEYYLDNLNALVFGMHDPSSPSKFWNLQRIEEYMKSAEYSESEIQTVISSVERTKQLIRKQLSKGIEYDPEINMWVKPWELKDLK